MIIKNELSKLMKIHFHEFESWLRTNAGGVPIHASRTRRPVLALVNQWRAGVRGVAPAHQGG